MDEQFGALTVLAEPTRRAIYRYVEAAQAEVGRDEAARAVGVSRKLAAFHLEKLLAAGLLEAVYRRLSGRSGPGAGRPAKLYRPSALAVEANLPRRRYDLAADILIRSGPDISAVRSAAHELGVSLGRSGVLNALKEQGYRPYADDTVIRLRNCPFQALAQEHRALICQMNLSLLEGFMEGSGDSSLTPLLDPGPGRCCVAFRRN